MKRLLLAGIFFLCLLGSAPAQVRVTIVDKGFGKVEGVALYLKDSEPKLLAISNQSGVAEVQADKFPFTIVTSHISYAPLEFEVTAAGDLTIQLTTSVTALNDVVITGQFEPQSVRQSVYQVRTINSERIMLRSPVNVQGVLSTELGIRFSNDLTLGTSDVSLMGMTGRNVKILLDGVPLLDRGDTRESLNQIDVNTIERIEIVEGPMSVVYGTDALAGVINIITKKYSGSKISIDAKVHEETAGNEYKAFSGKGVHNESVNVNWGSKKFSIGGGVTRNTFGGWNESRRVTTDNPFGDGEWHPKDQILTQSTIGYRTGSLNVWYRLNFLNEKISPTGNAISDGQTSFVDKEYTTNRFNHQLQADWQINDCLNFNGAASYQDLSRKTLTTNYNSATGEVTLSSAEPPTEAVFNMGMVRGFFAYKAGDRLSLQPGFEANLSTGMGDRIDRKRSINDYAAFVSVEYKPASFINIRPGLRFIHNTAYDAPPVIPSLNAKVALGKSLDFRIAYAYGFRSPSLTELYFSFHDTNHDIDGNPDLKAEYSNSLSYSLTWNGAISNAIKAKSVLGGFYNTFDNRIDLVQIGASTDFEYQNILKYKTTGATLENNFYWKKLSFTLGGSYIGRYNQLKEADKDLPELLWSAEVNAVGSYSFQKTGTTISAYYKFTGKRPSYFKNTEADPDKIELGNLEGFHMLDATVSQHVLKNFTATAGVKNIADVKQLANTAQSGGAHEGGSGAMSYGRSYFITLAYQWSK